MRKLNLLLICISVFLFSCEEESVVEIPLPFEKNYVISAEIKANQNFSGIKITQTVPTNEDISDTDYFVTDAIAYIQLNQIRIVPLQYKGEGKYEPEEIFLIEQATEVELFITLRGNEYYSSTIVPANPTYSNPRLNTANQLEIDVQAVKGFAYGALWYAKDKNAPPKRATKFPELKKNEIGGTLKVNSAVIPTDILNSGDLDSLYIQLIAFDEQYYDYYETRENNNPIEDIFSGGGGSVSWNIKGQGAIGLFIGSNYSKLIVIK